MPAVMTPVRAARSAPSQPRFCKASTPPTSAPARPIERQGATFQRDSNAKPGTPSRPAQAAPPARPTPPSNPRTTPSQSPASVPAPAFSANRQRTSEKPDHPILFQQYFKSVGPRTYALQVKKATNDNHYLVLTEGRRDKDSGEIRKLRLNIFSEDFDAFFDLLRQAEAFVKAHPLSPEFMRKRKQFWSNVAKRSKKGPAQSENRQGAKPQARMPKP